MLCSGNADYVICFTLTSRWCFFIRILIIFPISPMYTFPQEQSILYTPVELSGGFWSLRFLKICPIFLGGLKIIWMLYLFSILPIWFVVLFIYEKRFLLSVSSYDGIHCVLGFIALLVCLLIILFIYLFYDVRSFLRLVSDDWVSSVSVHCQRWWKFYVRIDSWLFLWWCDSACKYLFVCVGFLYT